MNLIPFNRKYLPPAFGFINLGDTCYFNGLVQSLLTCTSLTEVFLKNRNNSKFTKNPVAMVYLSIIDEFYPNKNNSINKKLLAKKNPELWHSMILFLRKKKQYMDFGYRQEDTHEAFILLMQCWEDINEIHTLFEHTSHNNYLCFDCKKHRFTYNQMNNKKYNSIKSKWKKKTRQISDGSSTYEIENDDIGWIVSNTHFITTHDFKDDISKYSNCKIQDLQDFINCQKNIHEGIKCIHCGSKNKKLGYYTLALIPEILVIIIKKYKFDKKLNRSIKLNINNPLPKKMVFEKSDGGKFVYKPISQIMHSGGVEGGHYWAHTLRSTNNYCKWYDLDDRNCSIISDTQNFAHSANTYTVIYHLMS